MKPAFEPEVTVSNSKNGAVPDAGVVASAREASLRYVTDGMPGITRLKRKQQKFDYIDPRGKRVRDSSLLDRIRRLAIPPAWEAVWICQREDGHLQATGRDARGRKQFGTTKIGEKFAMRPSMTA